MSKISKEGYDQIQVIKNALDSMYDKLDRTLYVKNDSKKVKDIEKQYTSHNIFGDVKDEFVCRGITQDIVNDLTKINTFRIPSAIEIDQYKDTELPLSEVARRMQVATL